jgi:hypothetical protein
MTKYTRRLAASLLASAALFAACRGNESKADSTALGTDTTLNRDLAMANRGDTTAQPQLKDVPANAPSTTTPEAPQTSSRPERRHEPRVIHRPAQSGPINRAENKPAPAPVPETRTTASGNTETTNRGNAANPGAVGGGAVGMIAAGATLSSHANSQICTNTNQVGDHVTATIDNAVSGSNGATIPAGATLNLTVTRLKRSENSNDPVVMEFAVNSVTFGGHTYPIDATVSSAAVDRVKDQPQSKDVQKVAVGAVAGAVLGHILGHSTKATVIGGAAGAAAGAATAAATANYQGCVQSGGAIVVKLTSAAQVRV